jgi:hypothetical protein
MQLYAVRQIRDRRAVGILYCADLDDLANQLVEPSPIDCEYRVITQSGGIMWSLTSGKITLGRELPAFTRVVDALKASTEGLMLVGAFEAMTGGAFFKLDDDDIEAGWQPLDPDGALTKKIEEEDSLA